jgi:hypothetical protein
MYRRHAEDRERSDEAGRRSTKADKRRARGTESEGEITCSVNKPSQQGQWCNATKREGRRNSGRPAGARKAAHARTAAQGEQHTPDPDEARPIRSTPPCRAFLMSAVCLLALVPLCALSPRTAYPSAADAATSPADEEPQARKEGAEGRARTGGGSLSYPMVCCCVFSPPVARSFPFPSLRPFPCPVWLLSWRQEDEPTDERGNTNQTHTHIEH